MNVYVCLCVIIHYKQKISNSHDDKKTPAEQGRESRFICAYGLVVAVKTTVTLYVSVG